MLYSRRNTRMNRVMALVLAFMMVLCSIWTNPVPAAAAEDTKAVRWSDTKADVRTSLDGRAVFQAARKALAEGEPVSSELAGAVSGLKDKKGRKMVGGRVLYEMEVPKSVKASLGVYADLRMFVAEESEEDRATTGFLRREATEGEAKKRSGKKETETLHTRESVMFRPDAEALEADAEAGEEVGPGRAYD